MKKNNVECSASDSFELTQRTMTPEGYLQAPAHLARTGIQLYRAREFPPLLEQGVDPDRLLRIYRPPEEVFDPESMSSFEAKPVIVEPHKPVNAGNWREIAVGDVGGIGRDGDHLKADRLTVRDKSAIEAVMGGKKYLSNGYTFNLDLTPGTTADGAEYDGIQRKIRGNHVALTDNPRGGPACRIADSNEGAKHMTKVVIDGIPFEAEDALTAAINKLIGERDSARSAQPSVTLKTGDTLTGQDSILSALAAKDTEIADLKGKILSPEQLDKLVNERVAVRSAVVGDASRIVPDFKPEGKTNDEVMRACVGHAVGSDAVAKSVVEAVLGGKTLDAADSATLALAFRAVAALPHQKVEGQTTTTSAGDAAVAAALTGAAATGADAKTCSGRDAFIQRQNDAWKKQQSK